MYTTYISGRLNCKYTNLYPYYLRIKAPTRSTKDEAYKIKTISVYIRVNISVIINYLKKSKRTINAILKT